MKHFIFYLLGYALCHGPDKSKSPVEGFNPRQKSLIPGRRPSAFFPGGPRRRGPRRPSAYSAGGLFQNMCRACGLWLPEQRPWIPEHRPPGQHLWLSRTTPVAPRAARVPVHTSKLEYPITKQHQKLHQKTGQRELHDERMQGPATPSHRSGTIVGPLSTWTQW